MHGRVFQIIDRILSIEKIENFPSYLNKKTQEVKYNKKISDCFNANNDVPQGTVLDFSLFNLYVVDR